MKGKGKSAFANTSTGYGKSKNNHSRNTNSNKLTKSEETPAVEHNINKDACPHDKDLNSGFGDYLRSAEAVEMMKLFVFANSIMLILTMAWPNLKEQYYAFMYWWSQ